MSYSLPVLPYKYDYLEPYFDALTMNIHYNKHHQNYINNTNNILESMNFPNIKAEILIKKLDDIPLVSQNNLRNNLGGHVNHCLFWNGLKIGTVLKGNLKEKLISTFNNIQQFQSEFEKIALSRFGSGWIWLVYHDNCLKIISTANQDNPLMGESLTGVSGDPIICLDLWEHSYYLQYQNRRLEYVQAFWNVVNWDEASRRYNECL
ncbi:Superoxide dismutase [Mn] [Buchnera aphidicola (Eriosoma grossulariae)]|uniref:Fe-Mn family superoxide dismutase n=1 Tax=Buchnera aphidicola TaxID=9 RepID=UPI00346445BF